MNVPRLGINLRDVHIYGGLALATVGGWRVSPAWTCIALGVTLAALGLVAGPLARMGRKE